MDPIGSIGEAPAMNGRLSALGVSINCESAEGVAPGYNGLADAFPDDRKSLNSSSSNILVEGWIWGGVERVGEGSAGVPDRDDDDEGGGGMRNGTETLLRSTVVILAGGKCIGV